MDPGAAPEDRNEDSNDGMAILATGVMAGATGATNSVSPGKSVHFVGPVTPSRPLSRKSTPFNQELSAEIRKAGLGAVFPDEGHPANDPGQDEGATGSSAVQVQPCDKSSRTVDVDGAEPKVSPRPPKPSIGSKETLASTMMSPRDN